MIKNPKTSYLNSTNKADNHSLISKKLIQVCNKVVTYHFNKSLSPQVLMNKTSDYKIIKNH